MQSILCFFCHNRGLTDQGSAHSSIRFVPQDAKGTASRECQSPWEPESGLLSGLSCQVIVGPTLLGLKQADTSEPGPGVGPAEQLNLANDFRNARSDSIPV